MSRLRVKRLHVRFHHDESRHPRTEWVSLPVPYDEDMIRAACAGTQGWPFEASPHVVIDDVLEVRDA